MSASSHLTLLAIVSSLSSAQFGFDSAIASGVLVSIHSDLRASSPGPQGKDGAGAGGALMGALSNDTLGPALGGQPAAAGTESSRRPLSTGEQELIVSITTTGAIVGTLLSAYLSRFWGRRTLILVSSLLFALGSIEQAASQYIRELVLGRAIVGLAIGIASVVTPNYISEVCPAEIRGQLVSLSIFFVTAGQVIAYVVSAALFHLPHAWRYMFLVGVLPAVVQLVGVIYLDESPRWLTSRGRVQQAREVLRRIYPSWSASQLDAEVEVLKASSGGGDNSEDTLPGSRTALPRGKLRRNELVTLFRDPSKRKALILTCGLQLFQQLCGFNALCYFGASILRMMGFRSNPVLAALPISIANCIGTVIAMRLVDSPKVGRRRLLLWTTAFAAVWLAVLGAALLGVRDLGDVVEHASLADVDLKPEPTSVFAPATGVGSRHLQVARADRTASSGLLASATALASSDSAHAAAAGGPASPSGWAIASLLCMIAFTMSYALGLGVVPWIVQAEALGGDAQLRAVGGALSTASNWTANLCVSAVFLDLVKTITLPGSFWLYSGITVLAWVFAYYRLPELRGVDIDDASRVFESGGGGGGGAVRTGTSYRPVRAADGDEDEEDGRGLLADERRSSSRAQASTSGGGGRDEDVWRLQDSDPEASDEDEEAAASHGQSSSRR